MDSSLIPAIVIMYFVDCYMDIYFRSTRLTTTVNLFPKCIPSFSSPSNAHSGLQNIKTQHTKECISVYSSNMNCYFTPPFQLLPNLAASLDYDTSPAKSLLSAPNPVTVAFFLANQHT